jgi:hypothetical protein
MMTIPTGSELALLDSHVPVLAYSVPPHESFGVESSSFVLGNEPRFRAVTDRGTFIPLFRYQALITPYQDGPRQFDLDRDLAGFLSFLEQIFVKNILNVTSWVERTAAINPASNCHGWTFAGGHFGVDDSYVPVILEDHKYSAVQVPQDGDIAVYCRHGKIAHSGLVRRADRNRELIIESKWGPFGVFVHPLQAQQGVWSFHRTSRTSHYLTIESIQAD